MNSLSKQSEQRWGGRVHLQSAATLRDVHASESRVVLRNASLGGAFIETHARPTLFSRVDIQPVDGPRIDAWVVRAEAAGIGVEWLEPGSAAVLAVLSTPRLPRRTPPARWLSIVTPWKS